MRQKLTKSPNYIINNNNNHRAKVSYSDSYTHSSLLAHESYVHLQWLMYSKCISHSMIEMPTLDLVNFSCTVFFSYAYTSKGNWMVNRTMKKKIVLHKNHTMHIELICAHKMHSIQFSLISCDLSNGRSELIHTNVHHNTCTASSTKFGKFSSIFHDT